MREILSLAAAREAGLRRYFTGNPCPRGHLAERFVSGRQCIECLRLKRPRRRKYPEKAAADNLAYRKAKAAEIRKQRREYRRANAARLAAENRAWYLANKDHANAYNIAWKRTRQQSDPSYKVRCRVASRIRSAIGTGAKKPCPSSEALGAPIGEVRLHLEKMFAKGMSWQNFGRVWHLDHIRPLAGFDLTDPDQFKDAFNYLNLRPLLKRANLSKGAKRELLL